MDRVLDGDTRLNNTQLRKLKLNTPRGKSVFERLTGVKVPSTSDTKTLIATARTAVTQAAERKIAAATETTRAEAGAQAGPVTEAAGTEPQTGAPEAVAPTTQADSAAAAWRSAPSSEQSQESFMAQLEQEAAMAAQEAETKSSPDAEPAAAFMPEGSAQSSASLLGQLEQEAAEIAHDAEVKSSRTSEPASAFIPEGVTGREDRSDMRRARVVPQEQAQGKRGKSRGRRYAETESRTQSDTVSQAMESTTERKPTQEQEWTAKYATAMLRGTSVKNVRVAFEGFSGQENAYYQDGEIVLNGNRLTTQRAINYILGHELTHPGADADADLVQSILDVGDSLLGSEVMSTRLSMTRERYIRSYMRNHGMSRAQAEAKVTLKLAKEETAADLMSELFEAPGAMERMGRESTGAKVLRSARDVLNRMLSKLTGKESQSARNEAEMLLERLNRALRSQESRGTMEKKEARSSVGGETDSPDYRGRQDAGRAGGGGQVRNEYRTAREGTGRDRRGDLGVPDGILIPSDARAAAEQNKFPNLELRETSDRAAFSAALDVARAANPNGGMVDGQSVEHLGETGARTFLRKDGLAGVAVESDGNIVGVFKNPNLRIGRAVKDLLLTAIAQGGTHLDCYVTGGKHDLATMYTQMGFVPVAWLAFNREYAPDGWNYEAWGEPDVVMWVHSGETALEVAQRSGTYPFFSTEYIHSLPQFDDYDAAKELQAQKVKEITEARKAGRRYSISSEQPFSEQVDRALTEDPAENRNRALYIRETPITLRGVGLGDLPMTITAKHVRNINHAEDPSGQHPEWHGIDKRIISRLPQLLERPVVIMDSATVSGDIVVVTEDVDGHGQPIVVSIRPNGTARVNTEEGPANFITSVYGRTGYAAWVNQAVRDGRVLYWNKNRSRNLSGKARVQFPAALTGLASNTIIKRHAGYVKDNIPERRFSVARDSEGREQADKRYSFGGVRAQNADLEALSRAKEMEQQGVAMETIFRETGWYTGIDGKWRFEISDYDMEYDRPDNMQWDPATAPQEMLLSDVLHHDELFRNYPHLRRARLRFERLPLGKQGVFNGEDIILDDGLRGVPDYILVQELQGIQPYSFQIGDNNYTIDWLAPTVLPLFVGAELHRMTNGEVEAEGAYEAMMTILEPVMALSMMSGLNDTLAAVRYEKKNEMVAAMVRNMVGSYFTQGVPTILGRVARTMDDSQRTSFVSAGATSTEKWLSKTFQSSVLSKIPVASQNRMLYIDAWGRADTEENAGLRVLTNFLSPGYYNNVQTTAVDEELMRLAEATNSTAVFPKRAEKFFDVNKETYAMTQEEYQEHLIERGQTSYQLVSDLISSPVYAGMSDKEKAKAVEKCYDYAAQMANLHTNSNYGVDPWVVKLEQMTGEGLDADDYFTAYAMTQEKGQNMKEVISSTNRYDGTTAAMLMAMDFDADDFTDPYARRYEYKLTDGQRETYRGLFVERLSSELSYLMSDDWYLDASVEERLEMLDETWSDTLDEVKRDMADWLWDHGIESTEKE